MNTTSDYKENAGQDRTSQLWAMTEESPTSRGEMGLEDPGWGRWGSRGQGCVAFLSDCKPPASPVQGCSRPPGRLGRRSGKGSSLLGSSRVDMGSWAS